MSNFHLPCSTQQTSKRGGLMTPTPKAMIAHILELAAQRDPFWALEGPMDSRTRALEDLALTPGALEAEYHRTVCIYVHGVLPVQHAVDCATIEKESPRSARNARGVDKAEDTALVSAPLSGIAKPKSSVIGSQWRIL